ncbi:lytic transglycosylase domain-containing protein [Larkinella punicea]|uniref:Lytic transglycosylase domain-containing protein n=2 Tax=Larkinella punicea TaxID=2315727 RepID=A0A368JSQ3_9BACT|nr:lytic transglycosylase domain-containing protein [Larkinella punicea]
MMLIVGISIGSGAYGNNSLVDSVGMLRENELPPLSFCGETVPTQEQQVARRLMKALADHATRNRALYRLRIRAAGFFAAIEPILAHYQIPPDFKYLPLVESALRSRAVSPKGAMGYWQLMPATARELGLTTRVGRDERQDLQKSTNAACRYLRYLHDQLGSWTLVAAAYNMGIGNLLKNIRRQQETDYYYLKLNPETGHYLYRIVAFKELLTNYRAYDHLIDSETIAYLSSPLPGEEVDDPDADLLSETLAEEAVGPAGTTALALPALPDESRRKVDEMQLAKLSALVHNGLRAKLVEAGKVEVGQVWTFTLIRGVELEGIRFEEGDLLYALLEDVDVTNGRMYFRTRKVWSLKNRTLTSLPLIAVDVSTGESGIPLPDLEALKAGWIVTWKAL